MYDRNKIIKERNETCELCGGSLNNGKKKLLVHHIIPRNQGGTDEPKNLQVICWKCHSRIHGYGVIMRLRRDLYDFLQTIDKSPIKALEIIRLTYVSNKEVVEMIRELRDLIIEKTR